MQVSQSLSYCYKRSSANISSHSWNVALVCIGRAENKKNHNEYCTMSCSTSNIIFLFTQLFFSEHQPKFNAVSLVKKSCPSKWWSMMVHQMLLQEKKIYTFFVGSYKDVKFYVSEEINVNRLLTSVFVSCLRWGFDLVKLFYRVCVQLVKNVFNAIHYRF